MSTIAITRGVIRVEQLERDSKKSYPLDLSHFLSRDRSLDTARDFLMVEYQRCSTRLDSIVDILDTKLSSTR